MAIDFPDSPLKKGSATIAIIKAKSNEIKAIRPDSVKNCRTRSDLFDPNVFRIPTSFALFREWRPIFLTAVTTFLGLGPMIFETNEQALFLVPMAISLGVGTLASSLVVLILVPVAFVMFEDAKILRPSKTGHPETAD